MKNQFVPYELAIKLKELGFNEECFGFYDNKNKYLIQLHSSKDKNSILAPLFQQAFDWFREKHNMLGFLTPCDFNRKDTKFDFIINGNINHRHLTYEEARQACLEKLIELCKKK